MVILVYFKAEDVKKDSYTIVLQAVVWVLLASFTRKAKQITHAAGTMTQVSSQVDQIFVVLLFEPK